MCIPCEQTGTVQETTPGSCLAPIETTTEDYMMPKEAEIVQEQCHDLTPTDVESSDMHTSSENMLKVQKILIVHQQNPNLEIHTPSDQTVIVHEEIPRHTPTGTEPDFQTPSEQAIQSRKKFLVMLPQTLNLKFINHPSKHGQLRNQFLILILQILNTNCIRYLRKTRQSKNRAIMVTLNLTCTHRPRKH